MSWREKKPPRYEGRAAYFDDPSLVPWPGTYATPDGVNVDATQRLRWVEEIPDDPDHNGGWWEQDEFHAQVLEKIGNIVSLQAEARGLAKGKA